MTGGDQEWISSSLIEELYNPEFKARQDGPCTVSSYDFGRASPPDADIVRSKEGTG
jgi:hypothetical protein